MPVKSTAREGKPVGKVLQQSDKEYLTTGVIAAYCGVSKITVLRWIAKGHLRAFRLPEGHYRVHTENFDDFCRKYEIPVCRHE